MYYSWLFTDKLYCAANIGGGQNMGLTVVIGYCRFNVIPRVPNLAYMRFTIYKKSSSVNTN